MTRPRKFDPHNLTLQEVLLSIAPIFGGFLGPILLLFIAALLPDSEFRKVLTSGWTFFGSIVLAIYLVNRWASKRLRQMDRDAAHPEKLGEE